MLRSIDCGLTAPLGADLCWCALLDRTCLPVYLQRLSRLIISVLGMIHTRKISTTVTYLNCVYGTIFDLI